jgi:hypothetical protein
LETARVFPLPFLFSVGNRMGVGVACLAFLPENSASKRMVSSCRNKPLIVLDFLIFFFLWVIYLFEENEDKPMVNKICSYE